MAPKRTTDSKRGGDSHREQQQRQVRPVDKMAEPARPKRGDEAEGQLGPDELPDPNEVIMNQEAKLHH